MGNNKFGRSFEWIDEEIIGCSLLGAKRPKHADKRRLVTQIYRTMTVLSMVTDVP